MEANTWISITSKYIALLLLLLSIELVATNNSSIILSNRSRKLTQSRSMHFSETTKFGNTKLANCLICEWKPYSLRDARKQIGWENGLRALPRLRQSWSIENRVNSWAANWLRMRTRERSERGETKEWWASFRSP